MPNLPALIYPTEYVRIQLAIILQELINEYDLTAFTHHGWIYFEMTKGVYGLKQDKHGYYQYNTTPGLW